mgnify:CR=1 FL=1
MVKLKLEKPCIYVMFSNDIKIMNFLLTVLRRNSHVQDLEMLQRDEDAIYLIISDEDYNYLNLTFIDTSPPKKAKFYYK